MNQTTFTSFFDEYEMLIYNMKMKAWVTHQKVNQTYDGNRPYGYHLSMVAKTVIKYGPGLIATEEDILPVIFAAYFHDSIEDARLSYNDVKKIALSFMTPDQAHMAAEIVYALTNDKGRTRAERAGEHYYEGIRTTPYAPFVKLCDRYANMYYSHKCKPNERNIHMKEVYRREWPEFIASIVAADDDVRLSLPIPLIIEAQRLTED